MTEGGHEKYQSDPPPPPYNILNNQHVSHKTRDPAHKYQQGTCTVFYL